MWLRSGEFIRDALRRDVEAVPHSTDLNFLSRDTQIGRIFRSNSRIQVFLIVDGHPVHKAKMVRDYVAVESDWLELFFLPAYASELNPDELVWNDLKNHAIGCQSIKRPDRLKRAVISFLRYLQRTPDPIRSYFRAPTTRYAAT